jgi:hypothetical protein
VASAGVDDSLDGGDVGVVAAPGGGDVAAVGKLVVGGIVVEPAAVRIVKKRARSRNLTIK